MKRVASIALISSLAAAGAAHAADVRVSRDACGPITVVAENALLSDVLAALAGEVAFEHRVVPGSDVRLSFDRTGTVEEVVAALARHRNVMLVRRTDETCGDRVPKILWVLESDAGAPSGRLASQAPIAPPIPLPHAPIAPTVEVDEPEPKYGPVAAQSPRRFDTSPDQTPEQRVQIRTARRAARAQDPRARRGR